MGLSMSWGHVIVDEGVYWGRIIGHTQPGRQDWPSFAVGRHQNIASPSVSNLRPQDTLTRPSVPATRTHLALEQL